jgi:flagellar hook-associated protein 3 FlgL
MALNAQVAGGSLFAGTATDGPALAPAATMLADLRAALAGATTAGDVQTVLDAWFDPLGGFDTSGYQGNGGTIERPLDAGESVSLGVRADDPALRGLLKAAATAALAPTLGLPAGDAQLLLGGARDALLSLTEPLTHIQASLGIAEGRAEEAQARHAARATAFGIQRAEMAEIDPFETATTLEATRAQLETQYALTQRLQSLSLARTL